MYYKYAVDGFFKDVETSGFNFLKLMNPEDNVITDKYYFFDPNLQFDERFHKRLSYKTYEDREEPFICAMWNMSVMTATPEQPRQFKGFITNTSAGVAEKMTVKHVECTTNICWISNDPEYLLSFEEYFMVSYDRSVTLNPVYKIPVTYQSMGDVIEVNQLLKTFKILGEFPFLQAGNKISIFQSLNNNGKYTVTQVSIVGGDTTVTVSESIPSSIVDGIAVKNNGILEVTASVFYKGIEFSEFNKLEPTGRGEITFLTSTMSIQYPIVMNKTRTSGDSGGAGSIIKEIHYKTKAVADPKGAISANMIQPYEEIIIE